MLARRSLATLCGRSMRCPRFMGAPGNRVVAMAIGGPMPWHSASSGWAAIPGGRFGGVGISARTVPNGETIGRNVCRMPGRFGSAASVRFLWQSENRVCRNGPIGSEVFVSGSVIGVSVSPCCRVRRNRPRAGFIALAIRQDYSRGVAGGPGTALKRVNPSMTRSSSDSR
jgi:hypothetical protein